MASVHANPIRATAHRPGLSRAGHPYWTEDTLRGVAARTRCSTWTPWRQAFAGAGADTERALNTVSQAPDEPARPWWQSGVLYQIYPRSFADTNADGMGDLPGIIPASGPPGVVGHRRIWLSPVTRSPNRDWGYDVSDFCAVEPDLGT